MPPVSWPTALHLLRLTERLLGLGAAPISLGDALSKRLVELPQRLLGAPRRSDLALRGLEQPDVVDRDRRLRRQAGKARLGAFRRTCPGFAGRRTGRR